MSEQNDFDQASRYTAKLNPAGFVHWLLPRLVPALTLRGWLDTRRLPFPGEGNRVCDTVAELVDVNDPRRRWALVIEFQSQNEGAMPGRLLDYQGRLYLELQGTHSVAAVLLNLTGPPQDDTLDMRLPGMEDFGLWQRVVIRTLRDEDAIATLAGIAARTIAHCILPWIPLMHGAGDPAIMNEWKRVAGTEPNDLLRSQYAELALVFAELAKRHAEWQQALEGWNMVRSRVIDSWRADIRQEDILQALELRFDTTVPEDLVAAVRAVGDLDKLSRWFKASQTAISLDEFRAVVQQPASNGVQ